MSGVRGKVENRPKANPECLPEMGFYARSTRSFRRCAIDLSAASASDADKSQWERYALKTYFGLCEKAVQGIVENGGTTEMSFARPRDSTTGWNRREPR